MSRQRDRRGALIVAAVVALGLLSGCGDDGSSAADAGIDADAIPLVWDDVSFTFDANCTECHAWANSYAGVVDKIETAGLIGRVESSHRIGGADRALVLEWLYDGYQEF